MDLREQTVYFKLSTHADVLGERRLLEALRGFEGLVGERLQALQDLGVGRGERPMAPRGVEALEGYLGRGVHLGCRLRLSCAAPEDAGAAQAPWLEVTSGGHPYTGRFRVNLEARVPAARFASGAFVERAVAWTRALITRLEPFMGHVHDTDDNAAQNVSSRALLRRAFGVEAAGEGPIEVRDNPGVEVSRGELRYAVNWLTILGPDLLEAIGRERALTAPGQVEAVAPDHALLRLYDSPLEATRPEARARQAAARAHLDLDALIQAQGPLMAYWARKSW